MITEHLWGVVVYPHRRGGLASTATRVLPTSSKADTCPLLFPQKQSQPYSLNVIRDFKKKEDILSSLTYLVFKYLRTVRAEIPNVSAIVACLIPISAIFLALSLFSSKSESLSASPEKVLRPCLIA